MRRFMTLAVTAAACGVLAGPAGTSWADESAQDTINRLQKDGYSVTVDKIGTGPISSCVVTSVRNPQTVTQWVPYVGPGLGSRGSNFLVPVVTSQTISVSLNCPQR
jgi:streptogramin lyase